MISSRIQEYDLSRGDRRVRLDSAELFAAAEPAARQEVQRKDLDTLTPHQRAPYDQFNEEDEELSPVSWNW